MSKLSRWLSGKESAAHAGDTGDAVSVPESGRSSGEGNGNSLQYSCLSNPMDRERSLVGYSPWSHKESDTTERLSTYTHTILKLPR